MRRLLVASVPQPKHLPALDGLRAVAVLLVLWSHVPVTTPGYPTWLQSAHMLVGPGGLGVEIFFVLSGFLITRILIDERERGRPVRWFLLRRLLRIFPIYYLLLLVMLCIEPGREIAWCAVYLSNLHSILEPGRTGPLEHTWSLCIEEHFYLLWPLLVAWAPRRLPPYVLVFVVTPLAWATAVWLVAHLPPGHAMAAVQHASPVRFLSLGAGSLIAYCEGNLLARSAHRVLAAVVLSVPALALHPLLVFVFWPLWTGAAPWFQPQHEPLVWLAHSCSLGTAILLLCLGLGDARWSPLRLLQAAPLRAVGRISYGLYLYHLPLYHWLLYPRLGGTWATIAILASVAVATLSYVLLERPILRHAARFR